MNRRRFLGFMAAVVGAVSVPAAVLFRSRGVFNVTGTLTVYFDGATHDGTDTILSIAADRAAIDLEDFVIGAVV